MNKDELVRKLAEEFGISTIDIYQLVNSVIDSMSNGLSKEKNINVSEFGKFKTLTRKDETGKAIKTVSFSPVKKFAHEVNFRYNDLNPTPIGLSGQKEKESFRKEVSSVEVSETITSDKNLSENINPTVMDNKDKYDRNIIRDELSQDSSNDSSDSSSSIDAFIQSKLDKSQSIANNEDSGIKEFELPHTLIELHHDITNENEHPVEDKEENTASTEIPDTNEQIDIGSLIEERKKALEEITPDYEPEHSTEQINDSIIDDSIHLEIEDRDKLEEFKSFEDERNAELGKIIAERNKIIDDINVMVNNTKDIPQLKETPKEIQIEEKSFENRIEKSIEETIEKPTIEEKHVADDIQLQEDKTFEHKVQYDETNLMHDNFDPIVTDEDETSSQEVSKEPDYADNDILTPEDTQIFREEKTLEKNNTPTSFEDVFETKEDIEKQKNVIHTELPETKTEVVPPVQQNPQQPSVPQNESYRQKMEKREQMYLESSEKSKKKGLWITAAVTGFLILIIYLAYNTGSFSPPVDQTNDNQQNNEQTPPPVTGDQKQETKPDENKQEDQQTTEKNLPPSTNAPEEVVFDNSLNVAFVKASDGIYIQTASLKNKSDADKMASGINKGNKEVFVKEADLGDKGKYYRVRIGKFPSMEEAKEFAGKLK